MDVCVSNYNFKTFSKPSFCSNASFIGDLNEFYPSEAKEIKKAVPMLKKMYGDSVTFELHKFPDIISPNALSITCTKTNPPKNKFIKLLVKLNLLSQTVEDYMLLLGQDITAKSIKKVARELYSSLK